MNILVIFWTSDRWIISIFCREADAELRPLYVKIISLFYTPHNPYKRCIFGCDGPIIKSTLKEQQCAFSIVTSPPAGEIVVLFHTF
jgi:hypothetical protein